MAIGNMLLLMVTGMRLHHQLLCSLQMLSLSPNLLRVTTLVYLAVTKEVTVPTSVQPDINDEELEDVGIVEELSGYTVATTTYKC